MKHIPPWKRKLYIQGIVIGVLFLTAVAMLGEVARQNWYGKVTAYPTKTEAAIETRARQLLDAMTPEETVGQLFLIHCGTESEADVIARYHPAGIYLDEAYFAAGTKPSVAGAVRSWQEAASVPLLIAVNEEGGEMSPISGNRAYRSAAFLSPRELYATGGLSLVRSETEEKCLLLGALGVNMNLAPVVDVTTDPGGFLYDRALGRDGETTGRYGKTMIETMNAQNTVGVLKHFPGYGNAVDVDRPYELDEIEETDLMPFREGIEAGAPAVMVGHMPVNSGEGICPASLSEEVHKLLRRELGFAGVVMTDDMTAMDAQAAVEALRAGCDLLLTGSYEAQYAAVLEAVGRGELSMERVQESVLRVLKLKIQFNIA